MIISGVVQILLSITATFCFLVSPSDGFSTLTFTRHGLGGGISGRTAYDIYPTASCVIQCRLVEER